jgi:DNA polymerase-3 subunit gamma/tau
VQGRFKVFMIDEVHMLTNTAFNAMLKTLEEPPEYLKFVLATTDPQKVPVTVLSRCLQFNLRPMAPETVLEHLVKVLATENVAAETQALRLLSRAARGSMRDALSLTDQAIAFGSGRLEEVTVRQMLGSVDRSYVFRLIGALAAGDGKTVVDTSEVLRVNGLNAASTLEEMSMVLQRMAVQQTVPGMAVDESDPDAVEVAHLAALMPPDETQLLYSLCLHGRGELGLAPDEYAALTMVLLRLLAFKPGVFAGTTAEKKTLKSALETAPVLAASPAVTAASAVSLVPVIPPATEAALQPQAFVAPAAPMADDARDRGDDPLASEQPPAVPLSAVQALPVREMAPAVSMPPPGQGAPVHTPPVAEWVAIPVREQGAPGARTEQRRELDGGGSPRPGALVPTEEGDDWHTLVQQLVAQEAITALVRELALQSQLVARDEGYWRVRVERESLNQPTARERLQGALQAAGHAVRLEVEIGPVFDSPARRNAVAAAQKQRAAEEIIINDPFVQAMMRDFGAKIVPGSIKPL